MRDVPAEEHIEKRVSNMGHARPGEDPRPLFCVLGGNRISPEWDGLHVNKGMREQAMGPDVGKV